MEIKSLVSGLEVGDVFEDGGRFYEIKKVYDDGTYSSKALEEKVYEDNVEDLEIEDFPLEEIVIENKSEQESGQKTEEQEELAPEDLVAEYVDAKIPVQTEEKVNDEQPREIDVLRKRAVELGITVQKMWGVSQLQNAIKKAEYK